MSKNSVSNASWWCLFSMAILIFVYYLIVEINAQAIRREGMKAPTFSEVVSVCAQYNMPGGFECCEGDRCIETRTFE